MRFVITGCGQSATTYVSTLLRAAGVDCGHEEVFDRWSPGFDTCPDWQQSPLVGDASYVAVPFLHQLPTSMVVVHLVRAPLDVVSSVVGRGHFDNPLAWPYVRFVDHHAGVLDVRSGAQRAAAYWLRWNRIAQQHAHLTWRAHEISADDIADLARLAGLDVDPSAAAAALDSTPRDIGSGRRAPVTIDALGDLAADVEQLADDYQLPITAAPTGDLTRNGDD